MRSKEAGETTSPGKSKEKQRVPNDASRFPFSLLTLHVSRAMNPMNTVVYTLSNDVSTDIIYPGRYMATVLPAETPRYAFADDADFHARRACQVNCVTELWVRLLALDLLREWRIG